MLRESHCGISLLTAQLINAVLWLGHSTPVPLLPEQIASRYQGRYQPVNVRKQDQVVGAAIDNSLASFNVLIRWRAGNLLRQNNKIAPEVRISTQGKKILVMTPLRKSWWTELNGNPRSITTAKGLKASLSRSIESDRLVERFVSERGKRTHHISLNRDGTILLWRVVVESKELPKPIRYTLKYRRR